jgi:hypothetical protein
MKEITEIICFLIIFSCAMIASYQRNKCTSELEVLKKTAPQVEQVVILPESYRGEKLDLQTFEFGTCAIGSIGPYCVVLKQNETE